MAPPDLERWGNPKSYLPFWVGRAAIIGGYLKGCGSVLDMGAGTQTLRGFITGEYLPVDCVKLSDDVTVIDLDSQWSADDLPQSEGIAMAGLLEHLADPQSVIRRLAKRGRVWAVSYMDAGRHPSHKLLTLEQIEAEFAAAGLAIDARTMWQGQAVYRLVR